MNRDQAQRNIAASRRSGAAMIIRDAQLPTREILIAATIKAQQGDTRARDQVVKMTCRQAYKLAEYYYLSWAPKLPDSAIFCDVFQAAIEGLLVAIDKYDHTTGNTFTTCANDWMRNYIQRRGIYPLISSIRIPEPMLNDGMRNDDVLLATQDLKLDNTDYDPDSTIGRKIVSAYDLQEHAHDSIEVERIMKRLAQIDERLPHITQLAMNGHDMGVAAHHYGVSAEYIRQLRIKARKILQEENQDLCPDHEEHQSVHR